VKGKNALKRKLNFVKYWKMGDTGLKIQACITIRYKYLVFRKDLQSILKIYSIVLNTETRIGLENNRKINHQFLTLLKADHLPSKLLKYLEILSISMKKKQN
jgi:hypothetical protein